jgi:hypothetical protein
MSIWTFLGWNLVLWAWCLGFGKAVKWLSRRTEQSTWDFWIGFCGVVGVLPVLHIFLPMGFAAAAIVSVIAFLGWLVSSASRSPRVAIGRRDIAWMGGWLILLVAIGWPSGMGIALQYDAGLYYQQVESWVRSCPAVPGLGNLHGRYAFPNTSFLLTGLLDALAGGPWGARLLGPFLLTRFFVFLMRSHFEANETGRHFQAWISLVLGSFALIALASPGTPVAAPDLVVAVLVCLAGLQFLRDAEDPGRRSDDIIAIAVAMVLLKTSTAPFAAILLAAQMARHWVLPSPRALGTWGAVSAGWLTHSWIQSGYALFPFLGRWGNPDWAMRPERVESMVLAIRGWARWMGSRYLEALDGWWWFWPWIERSIRDPFLRLGGILVVLAAVAWLVFGRSLRHFRAEGARTLLGVLGLSTIVWFFAAPDIRFHAGIVWLGSALLCGILLSSIGPVRWQGVFKGAFAVFYAALAIELGRGATTPMNPFTLLHTVRLPSGLIVNVPDQGDQVWRAPIPATPEITDLIPRGPSLCDGFRAGGRPIRLASPGVYELAPAPPPRP